MSRLTKPSVIFRERVVPAYAAYLNNPLVACSGTFAKDSDHLKLATAFDSKNVTFTDVEASDGNKVPASVLFANDPKRRLEVWLVQSGWS
jgi:hypothetical protein